MDDDRVMSFDEWCLLNGFSRSTGQRLAASGKGPAFIRLSVRRVGVTKAAGELHQRRLIEYSRGNIRIVDSHGLEVAACSCYQAIRDIS